jgi:SAM-dependent methyltransferase
MSPAVRTPAGDVYSDEFYRNMREGSLASARTILRHVVEWVGPAAVVDVGCGTGSWLAALGELSPCEILGVDRDDIPAALLEIPRDRFMAADLHAPLQLGRRFDLALCLEVAEHLDAAAGDGLLDTLTTLAPVVLFSAAIPHQPGTDHRNCRWPGYWAEGFKRRSFVAIDCIRPRVWDDGNVQWWYRQNTILYVQESELEGQPTLAALHRGHAQEPLPLVHPELYLHLTEGERAGREILRELGHAIRRRFRAMIGSRD